jgi:hypothetical protein
MPHTVSGRSVDRRVTYARSKKQIIYDRRPFTHEDENGGVGKRSAGLASGVSS